MVLIMTQSGTFMTSSFVRIFSSCYIYVYMDTSVYIYIYTYIYIYLYIYIIIIIQHLFYDIAEKLRMLKIS